jgi:antitoxin component YwqK of YwqJK toxin-antitoxin module
MLLKANYYGNMLNGKFEAWYDNGKPQVSGAYRNNLREGTWHVYKPDGAERYVLEYAAGVTSNRQADIDASNLIDSLELNKDKIADPEKTGDIR